MGVYLGIQGIPNEWVKRVEFPGAILEIGDNLLTGFEKTREWWNKYPGY